MACCCGAGRAHPFKRLRVVTPPSWATPQSLSCLPIQPALSFSTTPARSLLPALNRIQATSSPPGSHSLFSTSATSSSAAIAAAEALFRTRDVPHAVNRDEELQTEGRLEGGAVRGVECFGGELVQGSDTKLDAPQALSLRPYQTECLEHVLKALSTGHSRVGVSAPTGSGKTAMFTALIRRLPPLIHPHRKRLATKVLIIVGSVELAIQARDTVERWWPDLSVEIEQGRSVASGEADVTVATYQTLSRLNYRRLQKFNPSNYKAVIVDEAHHSAANSIIEILSYFDPRVKTSRFNAEDWRDAVARSSRAPVDFPNSGEGVPMSQVGMEMAEPVPMTIVDGRVAVPILGFTATWARSDGLALGKIFEVIAWHADWTDMIKGGWLSDAMFSTVYLTDLDLTAVKVSRTTGDLQERQLAELVNTKKVNLTIVQAWKTKAALCKSTLVFAINIRHIVSLANEFREAGIDARFVYDGTTSIDRQETLAAFKAGEFPVLVNCGILTEGADFPNIDCVLLARPTASETLYLQMVGRGLRLSPETGKTSCLILDCVGAVTSGRIISAPSLFGIDSKAVLEGQSTGQLKTRAEQEAERQRQLAEDERQRLLLEETKTPSAHAVHYGDIGSVFELVGNLGEAPVRSYSALHWVSCGNGMYILECLGRGFIKVQRVAMVDGEDQVKYEATIHERTHIHIRNHARPRVIASHADLRTLIRFVDNFVQTDQAYSDLPLFWKTGKRLNANISEKQLAYLSRKLGGGLEPEFQEKIDGGWVDRKGRVSISDLSLGEASDAITRLVHGGRKVLTKVRAVEARLEKKRKKARALLG